MKYIITGIIGVIILLIFGYLSKRQARQKNLVLTMRVSTSCINADHDMANEILSIKGAANEHPALKWKLMKGATKYAIYMVDRDQNYFLHWKATDVQGTSMELGEEITNSEYRGPFRKGNSHTYIIYIYALKAEPDDGYPGKFNEENGDLYDIEKGLDTAGGQPGNLIGRGGLWGVYPPEDPEKRKREQEAQKQRDKEEREEMRRRMKEDDK